MAMVLADGAYDALHPLSWPGSPHIDGSVLSLTGSTLGLLLVFRTNSSYNRFDEARKAWGLLVNRCRDIERQATAFFPSALHKAPPSLFSALLLADAATGVECGMPASRGR